MTHHVNLDTITISRGKHDTRDEGVCVMEAVAWFADEPHSDHPDCVASVLGNFCVALNDGLDDAGRQRFVPFIPRLAGTAGDGYDDERRAWMLTDWFVHTALPAWLDRAGFTAESAEVRALPPVDNPVAARASHPILSRVRDVANASDPDARDIVLRDAADISSAATSVGDGTWIPTFPVGVWASGWAMGEPAVEALHDSAFALLDRLIDPERN